MNPFWHLVWAIPATAIFGLLLAAYWPLGKDPEGPPFVGFDEQQFLRLKGHGDNCGCEFCVPPM